MSEAAIALKRFGLGARTGDAMPDAPRAWLAAQLARFEAKPATLAGVPGSPASIDALAAYQRARAEAKTAETGATDARRDARLVLRDHYKRAVDARIAAALATPAPFVERLVHFWANHFAVSASRVLVTPLAGAFEIEAIRPHVLGSFADMLKAAERHPAMLLYLDQNRSIGPDSVAGQRPGARAKQRGLNENLAREILELHTLGVRTGYDQADVTEFARALTGWTVGGLGRDDPPGAGGFAFVGARHEPGARTIMGRRYDQPGAAQAEAVLDDLARHPATARHVATKLARHFAADDPPATLVTRLETAFRSSGGDLPTVYHALLAAPETWEPAPSKFLTPWEWSIATMRAIGQRAPEGGVGLLRQLGQPVWEPAQPNGYDDIAASWAGPDALMRRVEAAERIAAKAPGVDARRLAATLHPGSLTPATTTALARAESGGQALALLLVAPEAMRR